MCMHIGACGPRGAPPPSFRMEKRFKAAICLRAIKDARRRQESDRVHQARMVHREVAGEAVPRGVCSAVVQACTPGPDGGMKWGDVGATLTALRQQSVACMDDMLAVPGLLEGLVRVYADAACPAPLVHDISCLLVDWSHFVVAVERIARAGLGNVAAARLCAEAPTQQGWSQYAWLLGNMAAEEDARAAVSPVADAVLHRLLDVYEARVLPLAAGQLMWCIRHMVQCSIGEATALRVARVTAAVVRNVPPSAPEAVHQACWAAYGLLSDSRRPWAPQVVTDQMVADGLPSACTFAIGAILRSSEDAEVQTGLVGAALRVLVGISYGDYGSTQAVLDAGVLEACVAAMSLGPDVRCMAFTAASNVAAGDVGQASAVARCEALVAHMCHYAKTGTRAECTEALYALVTTLCYCGVEELVALVTRDVLLVCQAPEVAEVFQEVPDIAVGMSMVLDRLLTVVPDAGLVARKWEEANLVEFLRRTCSCVPHAAPEGAQFHPDARSSGSAFMAWAAEVVQSVGTWTAVQPSGDCDLGEEEETME